MATYKNTSDNYTLTVANGLGIFTINAANTVFNGNITQTGNLTTVNDFIVIGANNNGAISNIGVLTQTGLTAFAGLRFNSIANAWQISSNVYSNGQPVSSYANITSIPGGANTQIQFNNDGVFGANANFTYNYANNTMTVGNIIAGNIFGNVSANISGTSANIIYVAANGNDVNNGSISFPVASIKQAMAIAATTPLIRYSVHVAPGVYTEDCPITIPPNTALMGDNLRNVAVRPIVPSSDMFYMTSGTYVWGITIRGFSGAGFSYNPATPNINVFVSPYIQNITSSTGALGAGGGTAVLIDGNNAQGSGGPGGFSTRAMILGFFTMINQGGKGVVMRNSSYGQFVNIYTIACDVGLEVESGAFCTLNGSDCSIGNYGLIATGYGPLQTSGNIVSQFQGAFVIDNLSSGNPHVNTVMIVDGDPEYYTIDTIEPNIPAVGNSTVLIQQIYLGNAAPGTGVSFYTRSSIIASAHTFEYVGAGTNPNTALPQYGGIPIEANEVIAAGGGVITFTSTDQKGNFKVGTGFVVNQATATITGDAFYRSLFAQMTPYILALSTG